MNKRTVIGGVVTTLALLGLGLGSAAAQTGDLGWTPWIGCWQADGAPADQALCVRMSDTRAGAAEILRVEGDQVLDMEVVWADGERHPTVRDDCEGWERGTFSADGRRVLVNSSHTCEGGLVQEGGGIMALSAPDEWLDVRSIDVGGTPTAWVQRYRLAPAAIAAGIGIERNVGAERSMRVRGARVAAAEAPDIDDVIEASRTLPAEAVEAWIAERGAPFDLDSDKILMLADAGVADRVVDVVVAVSNPGVFALTDAGEVEARQGAGPRRHYPGYYRGRGRLNVGLYDPFYYGTLGYGYGYNPGGLGYGSGYYGYGYRPRVVVIDRRDDRATEGGRVIAGRGYRGPRRPEGRDAGSVNRGSGSGGSSSAAPSSGSGGSRAKSGRKAKRRPPGGDGGLL